MPDSTRKAESQIEKFREAAKAIEAVSDEEYDAAVAKVAKAPRLTDDEIKRLARGAKSPPSGNKPRKAG